MLEREWKKGNPLTLLVGMQTSTSRHHFLWAPSPLLIATGESIPLLSLEGVPGLPGAPQDEAGLTLNQSSTSQETYDLVITNIYSFIKGDGIWMFLFNDNVTMWFHISPYNALTSFILSENGMCCTYFYLQQRARLLSHSSLSFSFLHRSEWLPTKCLQIINAGEGVEKREPSYTVGGNAN